MAGRIEDYAIIGDTSTVALVDRGGSIDWWCAPRVDSRAAFAALLGTEDNGRWLIAPKDEVTTTSRRYEPETLVLETVFETPAGSVAVTDFMPPDHADPTIHRIVEGRGGRGQHGDGADCALRLRLGHTLGYRYRRRAGDGGGARWPPLSSFGPAYGTRSIIGLRASPTMP